MQKANASLIRQQALPLSSPEKVDLDETPEFDSRLALMLQPPVEEKHQLLKQPSHIRLDVTETTGIQSLVSMRATRVASNLVPQIIRPILVVQ